jgi:hypothetical protein
MGESTMIFLILKVKKIFIITAKGPKQYSQNQLMSPMPREENLSFIKNYIAYEVFLNGI